MRTRHELADYAQRLLLEARKWASPNNALITFPGDEGGYGTRVDGLEGFARTFLLAGFLIAGNEGDDPHDFAGWYAKGIKHGVDPNSPERWIKVTEHGQAKVEAASLALILDMTRPYIWDTFDEETKQNVINYFAPVVGDDTYPRNNWIWFRIVVQTFLRSVGGPYSDQDIRDDLDTHATYVREGGWYSDGPHRAYDHYVGWAMHLYPALWWQMEGAQELEDASVMETYFAMLGRYLQDTTKMVGGNGSPLIQGRSMIYRFAAAAPYWVGAYAGITDVPLHTLRDDALAIISHFRDAEVGDILTMGWHHEWRRLAQSYSGPGSPYWAAKGMLGLALPASHPMWNEPRTALPVETADNLFAIKSPGWIVSTTKDDGIVRVYNHGADNAEEGIPSADSPLYARYGYSTVTAPLQGWDAWVNPTDMAVTVRDEDGKASHRSGWRLLEVGTDGEVGFGASTGPIQWLSGNLIQVGHGQGVQCELVNAGTLTSISLVRKDWELRLTKLQDLSEDAVRVRVGGWPLATRKRDADTEKTASAVTVRADRLTSSLQLASEAANVTTGVLVGDDDSQLGERSFTPWIEMDPSENKWVATLVTLTGKKQPDENGVSVETTDDDGALSVRVVWPDAKETRTVLKQI